MSSAIGSGPTSFDSFIESREVVATLYFHANADTLAEAEHERLLGTIQQLRKAQKDGRLIRVEGFSSSEGDQEANFILSFFRARAVADIIESKGLPSEVSLTGYGDLRAESADPAKERRVEIASYIKPVGMKKVKVAQKNKINNSPLRKSNQVVPNEAEIDSYRVDQAIRSKIDDKNRGIADKLQDGDKNAQPGLSQNREKNKQDDLDRGYTQWRKSVNPDASFKLSQAKENVESDLKRGYSQWNKDSTTDPAPGVTQTAPFQPFLIDALAIEQAIMEKIGTATPTSSGEVSQVGVSY